MNEFTIYCTEEQTKLAMELGAPIILEPEWLLPDGNRRFPMFVPDKGDSYMVKVPTSEQMINWLEKQRIFIHVDYDFSDNEKPYKSETCLFSGMTCHKGYFTSRGEATLAAINAALEYLSYINSIK